MSRMSSKRRSRVFSFGSSVTRSKSSSRIRPTRGPGGMPSSVITSLPSIARSFSEKADAARISSCTRSQSASSAYMRGDRGRLPDVVKESSEAQHKVVRRRGIERRERMLEDVLCDGLVLRSPLRFFKLRADDREKPEIREQAERFGRLRRLEHLGHLLL